MNEPVNDINNPIIDCSSEEKECRLQCRQNHTSSPSDVPPPCVIDEDVIVNGSILESSTIAIVGMINVTGDVKITGNVLFKLYSNATLHVGRCFVLDEESNITLVVVVNDDVRERKGSVIASYNAWCSSLLSDRITIEYSTSLEVDECRDGKPTVRQVADGDESGRIRLEMIFVAMDSNECSSLLTHDHILLLALSVAIPVGVVVIIVIVMLAVPNVRKKIIPGGVSCDSCLK